MGTSAHRRGRGTAWACVLALALSACGARAPVAPEEKGGAAGPAARQAPGAEGAAALGSLPYVNFVPVAPGDRGKSGVTVRDASRADRGDVLFVPKPRYEAVLVDRDGRLVHRWASDVGRLTDAEAARWPDFFAGWQTVAMAPNGDLFAVLTRHAVLKLDWSSRVVWTKEIPAHHDVAVARNGDVYVLTEDVRTVSSGGRTRVVLDDGITILRPDGSIRKRVSLFDVFARSGALRTAMDARVRERYRALDERGLESVLASGPEWRAFSHDAADVPRAARLLATGRLAGDGRDEVAILRAIPGAPADLFHANTVLPLSRDARGLWADGDVLVSLASWNLVAVVDMRRGKIRWSWGDGILEGGHDPTVLMSGNLLVFDNGVSRGRSRVLEVDPASRAIVWSYEAPGFFSRSEGGCEELPTGNVLVTDTQAGRVFEVTRDKRLVWEYFNPLVDRSTSRRSAIYRAHGVARETVAPLLAGR